MTIKYMNNNILLVILLILLVFFLFKGSRRNEEFKIARAGWTPNLYNKGKKLSTFEDKSRQECIKLCYDNKLCKSLNYNDNKKKCILTNTKCTKDNCNVSKEWTHWMKPYTAVNSDPDYLKVCNGAQEYWWFPRWAPKKVGKFSNDKECKSKCDKNLECSVKKYKSKTSNEIKLAILKRATIIGKMDQDKYLEENGEVHIIDNPKF